MTDCRMEEMRDLLSLLAHDALEPGDESRVRAHLDGCAPCRAEFALLGTLRARFDAATPAIDIAAITAAVQRETIPPQAARPAARGGLTLERPAARRGNWMPRRYLAAAASLLLVGSLSLAVLGRIFSGGEAGVDLDIVALSSDSAPAAIAASAAGLIVADGLSDLDADALSALLAELESVEATVAAEPVSIRQPIVDAPGGI